MKQITSSQDGGRQVGAARANEQNQFLNSKSSSVIPPPHTSAAYGPLQHSALLSLSTPADNTTGPATVRHSHPSSVPIRDISNWLTVPADQVRRELLTLHSRQTCPRVLKACADQLSQALQLQFQPGPKKMRGLLWSGTHVAKFQYPRQGAQQP